MSDQCLTDFKKLSHTLLKKCLWCRDLEVMVFTDDKKHAKLPSMQRAKKL